MCSSILERVLCGAGVARRARAGWVGVQVEVAVDVFLVLFFWFARAGLRQRRWGACERWCSGGDRPGVVCLWQFFFPGAGCSMTSIEKLVNAAPYLLLGDQGSPDGSLY